MSKEGNNTRHIGSFIRENQKKEGNSSGKNYLLAIAINDYEHCPKLYNAVKDAQDLIEVLTTRYQFEAENILTLIDKQATEENILNTFRKLASSISPSDNLLIFFSGHGEYDDIFKEGYWVPVNAKQGAIQDYVPNSKIKMVLNAIQSKHTFLIIDSCFSGSLFMQYRSSGLADRLERDPSRWGLTAGRNEIVADGEIGKNSPFADSLIYHLKNSGKSLGVSELCHRVIEDVIANANQTPRGEPLKVEGHRGGQFFFHLKGFVPSSSTTTQRREPKSESTASFNSPNSTKKKSFIPYIAGVIGLILLLVIFIPQLLKKEKSDQGLANENTSIEKEQISDIDKFEEKIEQSLDDQAKNPNEEVSSNLTKKKPTITTKELNKTDLWKEKVLPYLKKGEQNFKQTPPNLDKAEEYFKKAMEAASKNGLSTDEAMKYVTIVRERKAELQKRKETDEVRNKETENPIVSKPKYGKFEDNRDGRIYQTINLFGNDWMAEDLKYEIGGESWCYNDEKGYCDKYGRFYSWEAAKKACPSGWRMPRQIEWKQMISKLASGSRSRAYDKIMANGGSGMDVLLSGERGTANNYANLNRVAKYWTASEVSGSTAHQVVFNSQYSGSQRLYYMNGDKTKNAGLCRCIKK